MQLESLPDREAIDACAIVPDDPRSGLVELDDEGQFVVDGVRFLPRGVGSYPLLDHAGNGRMAEVDEILATADELGRPLVRTLAFLDGGTSPARTRNDDGSINEAGLRALDQVLAAAAARRVRLILVLTNHWPDYGGAEAVLRMVAPDIDLPVEAFYSEPRAIDPQQRYIRRLVTRNNSVNGRAYATDETIFAWELTNEARCENETWCEGDTLTRWARTMSETVRGAGATQLVAWGGAGQSAHGENLAAIAEDRAVDVLTLHVYPQISGAVDFGGDGPAARPAIAARAGVLAVASIAELARTQNRGLLLEEVGWRGEDAERALVLGAWLRAAREENVGALPWMIAERGRPDYDGFLIRPERDLATREVLECE